MSPALTCPHCRQRHRVPSLRAGERAHCARCDTLLARGTRLGSEGALACAVAGLLLAGPALLLPLVEVSKLSAERTSRVWDEPRALWDAGMHLLAVWVLLCGILVPLLLLGALTTLLALGRAGADPQGPLSQKLLRLVRACEEWSLPEVHVLAVLVAFAKLGSLVHVDPGAGLYCYAAMAVCCLTAWSSFEHHHLPRFGEPRGAVPPGAAAGAEAAR